MDFCVVLVGLLREGLCTHLDAHVYTGTQIYQKRTSHDDELEERVEDLDARELVRVQHRACLVFIGGVLRCYCGMLVREEASARRFGARRRALLINSTQTHPHTHTNN